MDVLCDINEDDELVFEGVYESSTDLFIANLVQFKNWIKKMNRDAKGEVTYLLARMDGHHWVFQEDVRDDEEFDCAIVKIVEGKVYAISEDVMKFVSRILKKFDIKF